MSGCDALTADASLGVAPALRAVDCLSNERAASAFGRLFGADGALLPALTIILTLYIAFFAISMLTGRSRIGISALTPRAMTLGLVLTFATSWVAYQGVVWNLAVGAPDQIAGILLGASGSATQVFADRIDLIFAAIAEVAAGPGGSPDGSVQAVAAAGTGSFTPTNLMWLGALLLLLGTVGVMVTARIALAVLLALGPIFVVLALFPGTRGLTAGWLRGVVLTAITPLFVVTGGALMLELLVPVIAALRGTEGIDGRAAIALFMIASIHFALMSMVLKVVGSIVVGWQVFGLAAEREGGSKVHSPVLQTVPAPSGATSGTPSGFAPGFRRTSALVPAMLPPGEATPPSVSGPAQLHAGRAHVVQIEGVARPVPLLPVQRKRGIGSSFALRPHQPREILR